MSGARPLERRPGLPAPYVGKRPIVLLWPDAEALPWRFIEDGTIEGRRLIRFVGTASSVVVKRETVIAGLKRLLIVGRARRHDDVELIRLWLRGARVKEIAWRLEITPRAVENRRQVLDLPSRRRKTAIEPRPTVEMPPPRHRPRPIARPGSSPSAGRAVAATTRRSGVVP